MILSAGLIFTTILGSLLLTLFLAIQIGEAPRCKMPLSAGDHLPAVCISAVSGCA